MIFNDTTTKQGIIQFCEKYTNLGYGEISDDTDDKLPEFTGWTNTAMSMLWYEIFLATGGWIFDDKNHSDLPQATTDLVSSQGKYALPSDNLTVKRVEIKNESDVWFQIDAISLEKIPQAVDEFRRDDGIPSWYRLVDDTIELFPASSYSKTAALKIYFDRGMVEFEASDTTKEPGFASEFHHLVPIGASLFWYQIHLPSDETSDWLEKKWKDGFEKIANYHDRRNKDFKSTITRGGKSWRSYV